eukprot:RCo007031
MPGAQGAMSTRPGEGPQVQGAQGSAEVPQPKSDSNFSAGRILGLKLNHELAVDEMDFVTSSTGALGLALAHALTGEGSPSSRAGADGSSTIKASDRAAVSEHTSEHEHESFSEPEPASRSRLSSQRVTNLMEAWVTVAWLSEKGSSRSSPTSAVRASALKPVEVAGGRCTGDRGAGEHRGVVHWGENRPEVDGGVVKPSVRTAAGRGGRGRGDGSAAGT